MKKTKQFTLLELYSIVDGRLSITGIKSVYDILGHIAEDEHITTIGLIVVQEKLLKNKPSWWAEIEHDLLIVKAEVGDNYIDQMDYIQLHYNPTYDIPSGFNS